MECAILPFVSVLISTPEGYKADQSVLVWKLNSVSFNIVPYSFSCPSWQRMFSAFGRVSLTYPQRISSKKPQCWLKSGVPQALCKYVSSYTCKPIMDLHSPPVGASLAYLSGLHPSSSTLGL